jgi:hypothetical protein
VIVIPLASVKTIVGVVGFERGLRLALPKRLHGAAERLHVEVSPPPAVATARYSPVMLTLNDTLPATAGRAPAKAAPSTTREIADRNHFLSLRRIGKPHLYIL